MTRKEQIYGSMAVKGITLCDSLVVTVYLGSEHNYSVCELQYFHTQTSNIRTLTGAVDTVIWGTVNCHDLSFISYPVSDVYRNWPTASLTQHFPGELPLAPLYLLEQSETGEDIVEDKVFS